MTKRRGFPCVTGGCSNQLSYHRKVVYLFKYSHYYSKFWQKVKDDKACNIFRKRKTGFLRFFSGVSGWDRTTGLGLMSPSL